MLMRKFCGKGRICEKPVVDEGKIVNMYMSRM